MGQKEVLKAFDPKTVYKTKGVFDMKFNKKFMAGSLAALLAVSSFAIAAPATKNLVANYGVTLNVNGSNFTVTDANMRPFVTQDGRTYVSIAALSQMGIATVNYVPASKTVQIKGGDQAQMNAIMAENARLLLENTQLKAKVKELEDKTPSKDNSNTTKLSDINPSDRRTLERDLNDEIRDMRPYTDFNRSQRLDGSVSIGRSDVTFNLYPYSSDYGSDEIKLWNDLVGGRNADLLEDDYEDFMDDVVKITADILKGYGDYNVSLKIYSGKDMKSSQLMVTGDYSYSRDRTTVYVNKVS